MKIIWIERGQETNKYYLTKAKFRTWWGKEFISICVTEKGMSSTKYFENGDSIPVGLWTSFHAFLESDMNFICKTLNKTMKIEVTTKHFRESTRYGDNENCPLAMAIKDAFPKDTSIDVGGWTAGIGKENYKE